MRSNVIRSVVSALAIVMSSSAFAQDAVQDPSSEDVVVMRRVIVPKADASTGAGAGGIIGGVVETLTGPSYGWYNVCASNAPLQICVAFDEDGGLSLVSDESRCLVAQSAVHGNFVSSLSMELLGTVTAIAKAGAKPAPRSCGDPPTRGYGYNCVYEGGMGCYSVDSVDGIVQPVEASRCAVPQKPNLAISSMLKANAMLDVGQGVTSDVCRMAQSAYGRKDECAWTTGSNGDRTMALKQSCFGYTKEGVVTPVAMATCKAAPPTTAGEQMLLRMIGLTPSDRDPAVSCVNRDAGANLVSKLVSDVKGRDGDGYPTRTLNFSFKCVKLGLPLIDKKPCAQQIATWDRESSQNANDALNAYESSIDLVAGTRTEIWTDYAAGNQ